MDKQITLWALGLVTAALLLYMTLPFLDVIVYGFFVYYITRPVYERLNRILKKDNVAALLSILFFILPVVLVISYAASVASFELTRFMDEFDYSIPLKYLDDLIHKLGFIGQQLTPEELWDILTKSSNLTDALILPVSFVIDLVFKLFLTFVISFYLLKDGSNLKRWLIDSLFYRDKENAEAFFNAVDADFGKIFSGNILVAVLTSFIAVILFYVMDSIAPHGLAVPYPFLLGLLCGLAVFVPAVGVAIIWVPLLIYLIIQAYLNNILVSALWFLFVFASSAFLLVGVTPDMFLRPMISAKTIHPGIMLLTYIFGYSAFGFMGLFLGPIIVVTAINLSKIILPKTRDRG